MTDISADGQPFMQQVIDRWNQAHPQTPATLQPVAGNDYVAKVQVMAAGSVLTDIFALVGQNLPQMADGGTTLRLDSYIQRDHYDLSDFLPLPLERMRWKGATVALPRGFSNQCVYWNVDMFDKAGVAHPPATWDAPGWDFAAFEATAKQLTGGSGGAAHYGFSVGTGFVGGWGQWILTNGGQIFDDRLTRCLIDQRPAVDALQFLQDLIIKSKVAPTPAVLSSESANTLFLTGRLAMLFAPVASTTTYRPAKFKWDLAVNPKGKGSRLSTAAAGAYWLLYARTKQPDDTWQLATFLASAESERTLATTYFPARRSALAYFATSDPGLPPEHRQVGIQGQELAQSFPATPDYAALNAIFDKQFAYLWDGSRPARSVAQETVSQVNAYRASHPQA